jgi:hypothetical protein
VSDSQADSAGSIPVTRSIREKHCHIGEFDRIFKAGQPSFASYKGTVPLRVPLAILASSPGRLSVPKLTVRLNSCHPLRRLRLASRPTCARVRSLAEGVASGRLRF